MELLLKYFLRENIILPHFHAIYGEYNGTFEISTLNMLEGDLPLKAQALVKEWAAQYADDIMKMWDTKILKKLPPLE